MVIASGLNHLVLTEMGHLMQGFTVQFVLEDNTYPGWSLSNPNKFSDSSTYVEPCLWTDSIINTNTNTSFLTDTFMYPA